MKELGVRILNNISNMESAHFIAIYKQRWGLLISWQPTANLVSWPSHPNEKSSWGKQKENVSGELGEICIQSGAHYHYSFTESSQPSQPWEETLPHQSLGLSFNQSTRGRWGSPAHRWAKDTRPKQPRFNILAHSLRRTIRNASPALHLASWKLWGSSPSEQDAGRLAQHSRALPSPWVPALSFPYCQLCHSHSCISNSNEILAHSQHWINVYNLELEYIKAKCWHSLFPFCLKFETRKTGLWG